MNQSDLLQHYPHPPIVMGTKPIKPDEEIKLTLDPTNQVLVVLPSNSSPKCSECGRVLAVYERRSGRCNDCTTKIYREVRAR